MTIVVSEADRVEGYADLIARLRWTYIATKDDKSYKRVRNPDGAEAADALESLARHAATARLEGALAMREGAGRAISHLAWIQGQAESAADLASASDGAEEDMSLIVSFASDIAINAAMAIDKLVKFADPISGEGGK